MSNKTVTAMVVAALIATAGCTSNSRTAANGLTGQTIPDQNWSSPVAGSEAIPQQQAVTVKETVEATLGYNRGLKVIQENLDVTRHELRRAKAGYGPSVDLVGRAGANELSTSTTRSYGADKDMYGNSSIGLTLTQPLWDGFATRSRVASAQATVDSMSHRVFDNATTFALDGIIAHVDLLRRREILQLAEENVARHREILVSQKDRISAGASSSADVSQTQGRLSRALSTLTDAQASLREAESSYIRLTGRPAPADLAEVDAASGLEEMDSALAASHKSNPKLRAYLSDIKSREGDKELAKSAYHPKINLEAGPSYSDRAGKGSQWQNELNVGLTVRWNLFNSGADDAEVMAATSRIRQAREEAANFVDELDKEIADTWTRWLAAKDLERFYSQAVVYNRETRDAYTEQFILGQRSLLDVLDAESELFNSSTQLATARGNIVVGSYRLHALIGDLLPALHVETDTLYIAPGSPQHSED